MAAMDEDGCSGSAETAGQDTDRIIRRSRHRGTGQCNGQASVSVCLSVTHQGQAACNVASVHFGPTYLLLLLLLQLLLAIKQV